MTTPLNPSDLVHFIGALLVCQGANPDVKYEVQYSSYVNVTLDGFVVLKRVVKTESFALQVTTEYLCRLLSTFLFILTLYNSLCLDVTAAQSRGRDHRGVWDRRALRPGHTR